MLEARSVCKSYGQRKVLQNVDISLSEGKTLGIFGPNGSGKSTLTDILALTKRPDSGTVLIDGRDALQKPGRFSARIGYVPQDIALFDELTVRDNLLCFSRQSDRQARERIDEVSEKLCMESLMSKRITELSGGMKRRVNYAVSLLGEADIFLLDEPFSGVDMENAVRMLGVLKELARAGATQMISEHSAHLLLPVLDEVLVLLEGRVLFRGTPAELLAFSPSGEADDAVFRCAEGGRR